MTKTLLDQVIETDYGQFDFVWTDDGGFDGDDDRFFAGQVNGLAGAATAEGIYLVLSRRSGGSHVQAVLDENLPADPGEIGEDVVEVSTTVPVGSEPRWQSWAHESSGELDLPAGSYRVRVSSRGRDAAAEDEFADGIIDHYFVEFWPAPPGEDVIVRARSENARYWHQAWGNRR